MRARERERESESESESESERARGDYDTTTVNLQNTFWGKTFFYQKCPLFIQGFRG